MCLSKIYIKDTDKNTLVVDEAAQVINDEGVITISTLFGNEKELKGYFVSEVNLVENYILMNYPAAELRGIILSTQAIKK